MKSVAYFFIYAMALFNCYVWMIWPELLFGILWKWDIFMFLLFGPLIYSTFKYDNSTTA